MVTLKIERSADGKVWVTLTRFSDADLARLKEIPGRRWNPERKQWSLPDNDETRQALAEIIAAPPTPTPKMIAVNPHPPLAPPASQGEKGRQRRGKYVPGRDQPLTTNPPHPLIKQVDDELVLRGMAYGTRKAYGQHLRNYFDWLKGQRIEPERATREHIRAYLVKMASSGQVSAAYCRGARSALVFLYEVVLRRRDKVDELPRMKRPEQLPTVLSREEIARLLQVTQNLKHKALLTIAYSAGLRVGEAVRLKVSEIDSKRMQVRITASKGAKDRDTLLSEKALGVLRAYFRAFQPKGWLFAGETPGEHLSEREAQQVFKGAKKKAGIIKPATFHTLRHSFATHLLEDRVDVRYIQELMGHDSIETTERYTHVTERGLGQVKSPLDRIELWGGKSG